MRSKLKAATGRDLSLLALDKVFLLPYYNNYKFSRGRALECLPRKQKTVESAQGSTFPAQVRLPDFGPLFFTPLENSKLK
ncbi:MAG: hypothetical protein A3B15_00715 [Candidatus Buchananbacteria bacterium RIFCSPLOWO2_01_FULL_45_31]|uniref:Uncharacterized protein n=1 Tax=Candidatus Buchananbacteria bacterium RIFCSPLOWO2_01_FULL_45_31 TaxID=1797545 RepID=A0A1G1YPP5_9BACT|nr:MAG: hypothetical protein A3B15_00715 [Candidatus Buchananbacteria bacterium RIFCSPLOWO2_01_FULL_45_31]